MIRLPVAERSPAVSITARELLGDRYDTLKGWLKVWAGLLVPVLLLTISVFVLSSRINRLEAELWEFKKTQLELNNEQSRLNQTVIDNINAQTAAIERETNKLLDALKK